MYSIGGFFWRRHFVFPSKNILIFFRQSLRDRDPLELSLRDTESWSVTYYCVRLTWSSMWRVMSLCFDYSPKCLSLRRPEWCLPATHWWVCGWYSTTGLVGAQLLSGKISLLPGNQHPCRRGGGVASLSLPLSILTPGWGGGGGGVNRQQGCGCLSSA
jgi:hypothetical protein